MKLHVYLHSLVCLGWIMDYVPFLIFCFTCICIYCVTINDFELFFEFLYWYEGVFMLNRPPGVCELLQLPDSSRCLCRHPGWRATAAAHPGTQWRRGRRCGGEGNHSGEGSQYTSHLSASFRWFRTGVGVTKPILSVPLFSTFSVIVKTNVSCWISRLYLAGVAAAQLRWHLSNINVIQGI